MKQLKKVIAYFTVFVLIVGSATLTTMAEESTDYISVNEFEAVMNELYSKYDSSFEISDDNDVQYISMEFADEMYQKAATALEEKAAQQSAQIESAYSLSGIRNQNGTGISPLVMPVMYYDSDTFTVSGATVPLASSNYKLYLSGSVNAQYNSFISLTYSGVYQNGSAINYDGFDIVSETTGYFDNKTAYMVGVTMDVYFSWTDPSTGLKFSETIRYNYLNTFYAVDGI